MTDALKVAKRDFLENVKRKSFLYVLFGLPLLMLAIFTIQANFGSRLDSTTFDQRLAIVDENGIGFPLTNMTVGLEDVASAKELLLNKLVGAVLIIGPDYLQNGTVTLLVRQGDLLPTVNPQAIQAFLQTGLLQNVSEPQRDRILQPPDISTVSLAPDGTPAENNVLKSLVGFALGGLLIFSIFMSSSFLLQGVMEEKENRVIEILLSSISATDLMAGKILGLGALALLQVSVWICLGLAVAAYAGGPALAMLGTLNPADIISPIALLIDLVYFIGGFLLYSSILACIGAISSSSRDGQQISAIVIVPAASPLWFLTAFLLEPNGAIAQFLSIFPLSSPLAMIIRSSLTSVPLLDLAASIIVLYGAVALAIWGSAKLFRATILMYGQRPGVRQMLSILKQA